MAMGFWLFVIVSIGSIPLAGAMAPEVVAGDETPKRGR